MLGLKANQVGGLTSEPSTSRSVMDCYHKTYKNKNNIKKAPTKRALLNLLALYVTWQSETMEEKRRERIKKRGDGADDEERLASGESKHKREREREKESLSKRGTHLRRHALFIRKSLY